MNREELKNVLPHREPMLLVDESVVNEDGSVHSSYTIREDEFFTRGHFPGYPVVPGVILCEIMAQGSVLTIPPEDLKGRTALYGGLNNVRFKNSVFPGDTVVTDAVLVSRKGPVLQISAKATVNGKLCTKGDLTIMLVDNENLKK